MDDIVKQAMAKWPNVPAVYGWLALNRRGQWLIKDEPISNPAVADFINRNYDHDAQGRWFFQNGPQRVFVTLEYTPFVCRLRWDPAPAASVQIETHTHSTVARVGGAWIDEAGIFLLATENGIGMMDGRDLERLLPCFNDAQGAALAEDAITDALELLQNGGRARLYFRYGPSVVRVSAARADGIPEIRFRAKARAVRRRGTLLNGVANGA